MHIILVGLNHETAPVELREKLAFADNLLQTPLTEITNSKKYDSINEVVILSTCNRVEIYAAVDDKVAGLNDVKQFLVDYHAIQLNDFEEHLIELADAEVVQHLFEVSSTLKSMIVGETQIQAQIKHAFEAAREFGTSGTVLSTLFQNALSVGKRVRHETEIGEHSLSVSHAAVMHLKKQLHSLSGKKIAMIGSGKMGRLAINALIKNGSDDVLLVNRTKSKAQEIADELDLTAYDYSNLEDCLVAADAVISSTGAPNAILTVELMQRVMTARNFRPLHLVDIAVPRDIENDCNNIAGVELVNIDSLQAGIDQNRQKRILEMEKVRTIVQQEVTNFLEWLESLKVKPLIMDLRKFAEEIREKELSRVYRKFENGFSDHDSELLQDMTRRIINKMLHVPISQIRAEAVSGNEPEMRTTVKNLFGL